MATLIVRKFFTRVSSTPRSFVENFHIPSSTRLFSSNYIENEDHIAIDLGDANYRVAVMEGQTARIVDASPAVIAFNEKGEYVFGTKAVQQGITHPKTMVYGINRLLGRKFDDPFVQTEMKKVSYNIVKGSDGDACVEVYGKVYSPSSIRAGIVNNIMKNAESYAGKPVCNAIISLPAHCKGESEVLGGEKTMMEVLYESAVAGAQMNIFYGICPIVSSGLIKKEGIVAILDMGCRTFSASILEMSDHSRVWLTKYNDMFLGGEDFDNALMEYLMSEFKSSEAIDLNGDHVAVQRLRKASEKAKMELSYLFETEVNLPYITTAASGAKHINVTVARSTFERLVEDLVQRVKSACENCLEEAGISGNDVDEVLLVGGMSRVPKVKTSVTEIFGKSPCKMRNPDEAVALGAAELIEARVLPRDMWKQVREVTKEHQKRGGGPEIIDLPTRDDGPFGPMNFLMGM